MTVSSMSPEVMVLWKTACAPFFVAAPEVREALEHEWLRPEGYSSDLTDRQKEVLVLLAQGRSAQAIPEQLNISAKTVEFHKANITRKLGVHTTSELIKFALSQGLTSL